MLRRLVLSRVKYLIRRRVGVRKVRVWLTEPDANHSNTICFWKSYWKRLFRSTKKNCKWFSLKRGQLNHLIKPGTNSIDQSNGFSPNFTRTHNHSKRFIPKYYEKTSCSFFWKRLCFQKPMVTSKFFRKKTAPLFKFNVIERHRDVFCDIAMWSVMMILVRIAG